MSGPGPAAGTAGAGEEVVSPLAATAKAVEAFFAGVEAALFAGLKGAGSAAKRVWIEDRPRREAARLARLRRWQRKGGLWRLAAYGVLVAFGAGGAAKSGWRATRAARQQSARAARQAWTQNRTQNRTQRRGGQRTGGLGGGAGQRPPNEDWLWGPKTPWGAPSSPSGRSATSSGSSSAGSSRGPGGAPESDADAWFSHARQSGWTGPIDQDGNPVPDLDAWIAEQMARAQADRDRAARTGADGPTTQTGTTSTTNNPTSTTIAQEEDMPAPSRPGSSGPVPSTRPAGGSGGANGAGSYRSVSALVDDLQQQREVVEEAETLAAELMAGAQSLPDMVTAADGSTERLQQLAPGVASAQTFEELAEALQLLGDACAEAETAGEATAAVGFSGDVAALSE